jgi:type IV pilus assembly protein PilA
MNKTNKEQGFTLIELLVVIAIIGILSSVVLASLNTARGKGADATIKGNLEQIRSQAEIIYDSVTPNSYATVCTDTTVANGLASAANALGGTVDTAVANASAGTKVSCHASANAWAATSGLKGLSGQYFCVDSTGKGTTSAIAVIAGSGATQYACP